MSLQFINMWVVEWLTLVGPGQEPYVLVQRPRSQHNPVMNVSLLSVMSGDRGLWLTQMAVTVTTHCDQE